MFYSWIEDKKDKNESDKNHAYLIGGFSNPAMLQKILNKDQNVVSTTEEDFEKTLEMIKDYGKDTENNASLKRRRKRKKIGNQDE
jgi:hypothetical protein